MNIGQTNRFIQNKNLWLCYEVDEQNVNEYIVLQWPNHLQRTYMWKKAINRFIFFILLLTRFTLVFNDSMTNQCIRHRTCLNQDLTQKKKVSAKHKYGKKEYPLFRNRKMVCNKISFTIELLEIKSSKTV